MALPTDVVQELIQPNGGKHAVQTTEEAYSFCLWLMRMHYENFPVGSLLVGKELQPHFAAVYAFARLSDDVADELQVPPSERLAILDTFMAQLHSPNPMHPVFHALQCTMQQKQLPAEPFQRLLQAFRMDSEFTQPIDWQEVHHYCAHSANPVGEIVLRLFGECTEKTLQCSDAICTGLQLANFWQDLSIDLHRGRFYIPKHVMTKYRFTKMDFVGGEFSAKFPKETDALLHDVYIHTHEFFESGVQILRLLRTWRLRCEVALTIEGGRAILAKTKKKGRNIFISRPSLGVTDVAGIVFKALWLCWRY